MNGFIYSTILQWKLDFRNRNILLVYYIVPIIFYMVMGSVFSSINPESKYTLISTMTIFAVSMGAFFGTPSNLMELFTANSKKAYMVGNIPLWSIPLTNYLSGLIHLLIVSLFIFFMSPVLFKATMPEQMAHYFLGLVLFISVSLVIGILIGFLSKSNAVLTTLSQFIFLPSILMSGIMFEHDLLPKPLIVVSHILPATHAMKILSSTGGIEWTSFIALLSIAAITLLVIYFVYQKSCKRN